MATNKFTTVTGSGKYPRAIRELQGSAVILRAGSVPGALVSQTPRGTLIEPDPMARPVNRSRTTTDLNVWR